MTPAGIEPATFRFVAQHLNHCATAVPGLLLCWWKNIKICCHTGHILSVHLVWLSVHYCILWHNNVISPDRQPHELYILLELHAPMCTGLLSKHSIYTKQCHIQMIHSTIQHPSSWTVMAGMLTFHDHPFYNQFCWPVVPGSDNNQNATAGLWVSFPHYPVTAQITLSTVFRLWIKKTN